MKSVSNYGRKALEKYFTPHSVVHALVAVEYFQGAIWDPGAGAGHIVNALWESNLEAYGTDISPDAPNVAKLDFLAPVTLPVMAFYGRVRHVVGNPPYGVQGRLAVEFIDRALRFTAQYHGKVAMLLHEDFDAGKTRRHLFGDHPAFARKYVLTNRIYWANLEHTERPSTNHAWFVWDWSKDPDAPPTLHYIHGPDGQDFR